MKKLPISIQTFSKFAGGDYLYVDKTKPIYDLLAGGGQYYFLSRPRRFGKSVLVSTLAEIFSGNKELFKGLWIYDKIQWTPHPVIYIDFSNIDYQSPNKLKQSINKYLNKIAADHGVTLDEENSEKESFVELIEKLSAKGKVVILIDEYDKPLIEYVEAGELKTSEKIRRVLKSFFGVIKGMDAHLQFVFITGVSKFSKVSVFSDLNNLVDITLGENYSTLLGYTETELRHYFSPYIEQMAEKRGMSPGTLIDTIREWYNGYSWDGENFVYNPFSILNLFNTNSFENFWFASGTPTFLVKLIKNRQSELIEFENWQVKGYISDSFNMENPDIVGLLFQTGYLTIKRVSMEKEVKIYELSYPNREVKTSFLQYLLESYSNKPGYETNEITPGIKLALTENKIDDFIRGIKVLLSSIPYNIHIQDRESYYHSLIYLALKVSLMDVQAEVQTAIGRSDVVVSVDRYIYIIEFKRGSAQSALDQIEEKQYYSPYLGKNKKIILLGIGLDEKERNIGDWISREIGFETKMDVLKEADEEKWQMVRQMLADGLPVELIVKYSGLTEEEIKGL